MGPLASIRWFASALAGALLGALLGSVGLALIGAIVPPSAALVAWIPVCVNFGSATAAMIPGPIGAILGNAAAMGMLGLMAGSVLGCMLGVLHRAGAEEGHSKFMTREQAAIEAERRIERRA